MTTKIKRGEVYSVNLIEEDAKGVEIGKKRPAIVVQVDAFNMILSTVIIVPLTSAIPRYLSLASVVLKEGEANLKKESNVLFSQMRSVDKTRLEKRLGKVSLKRMEEIDQALSLTLGLTPID